MREWVTAVVAIWWNNWKNRHIWTHSIEMIFTIRVCANWIVCSYWTHWTHCLFLLVFYSGTKWKRTNSTILLVVQHTQYFNRFNSYLYNKVQVHSIEKIESKFSCPQQKNSMKWLFRSTKKGVRSYVIWYMNEICRIVKNRGKTFRFSIDFYIEGI